MKLRISCCKTVLAKDLTRFAPAWGLYLIGLLMVMLPNLVYDEAYVAARTLGETIGGLGILNFLYAALCVQLVFGDLFQPRMCHALHAMPLKRSDWFFSHIAAGISFSLVPNTVCTLLMMPLLGNFWFVSLFWMGAMTLEFLFFFGLALLSMFCVGHRFAMVTVYGILNFLSVLALWFVKIVFEPLLLGMYLPPEPFYVLSPVVQLTNQAYGSRGYVCFEILSGVRVFTGLGDGWGYLLILGGIGLLLGALALLLYRRRALETAGDFMAVRPLAPIFCVVYTLVVMALFASMGDLFMGETIYFFPVGFVVGYFTSQMLLRRTVKVFQKKVFLWFGIFAMLIAGCVALTVWDPLGYTRWAPEPSQVARVQISNELDVVLAVNGLYAEDTALWEDSLLLDDPEDIAAIVDVHREVTEQKGNFPGESTVSLRICYTLQNGADVTRVYENCVPAAKLKEFFSRQEYVLGINGDADAFISEIPFVNVEGNKITGEPLRELLKVMIADCQARTMAQGGRYHSYEKGDTAITWIDFQRSDGNYRSICIYSGAENTVAWLKENFSLWADENIKMDDYFRGK